MALCGSKSISYWLYPSTQLYSRARFNYIEGSSFDRTFLIVFICLGLVILYGRRDKIRDFLLDNRALILLFAYALTSISWSAYQGVAIKRWIRAVGDIVMALVILTDEHPKDAFEHVIRRCGILLIPLSLYFIKFNRVLGVGYTDDGLKEMWIGVTLHKNLLGQLCAIICVFLLWRMLKALPKIDIFDLVCLVVSFYLLVGSHSATSIVVFIIGASILIGATYFGAKKKKFSRFILASIFAVFIIQGMYLALYERSATQAIFGATGRDPTFTGRLPLWTDLIKIGKDRTAFGHGYGSFWLGSLTHNLWDTYVWMPTSGHNGYIDVFLDLGLVGLVVLIYYCISTYRRILGSMDADASTGKLMMAYFIMIILHNITESSLAQPTSFLWFIFLLISIKIPAIREPAQREHI